MNIYNEFRKTAINRYSKTALVMMNDEGETKEYTFGQTLQQVDIFCSRLKAMGVVAGDRVCIASEGSRNHEGQRIQNRRIREMGWRI